MTLKGWRLQRKEATAEVVGIAELELEVELKDVYELLQSQVKL
jgi:hypothetical protein